MKSLMAIEKGRLAFQELPILSEPQGTDVNIRILAAGICGSDLHIWHGTNPFATYPRVLGHEIIGEITGIGPDAKNLSVGDRVIVNQLRSCGQCYACRIGRPNVCKSLNVVGVHLDGGFQESMQLPESSAILLPDNLAATDAVMIEPLSIAVQGCWRVGLTKDDTLLILGAGALGSSLLRVARNSGAKIIMADVAEEKLTLALQNGADHTINTKNQDLQVGLEMVTDGYGPTAAIDAACFHGSLQLLLKVIGNAGRIVTMGFSTDEDQLSPVQITGKEIDIRGSRLQSNKFPEVIEMVRNGKLSLDGMVSHVFPFSKAIEAMELAASGRSDVQKVVLDMTL